MASIPTGLVANEEGSPPGECLRTALDSSFTNNAKIKEWARVYWKGTYPYSPIGSRINIMMEEGHYRKKSSYM